MIDKRLVIFAGAGASLAVSSTKFPATQQFFEQLPKSIAGNALYEMLVPHIKAETKKEHIDIEDLLGALYECARVSNAIHSGNSALAPILSSQRAVSQVASPGLETTQVKNMFSSLESHVHNYASAINQLVYDLYSKAPSASEYEQNWKKLISRALKKYERVEIFTTNYDVVLETVIENEGFPIYTGRTKTPFARLNTSEWTLGDTLESSRGRLTKIHGSVDWQKSGNEIFWGAPAFTGSHDRHVILYPAKYKSLTEWPFNVFHQYFATQAKIADAAIFVGFAFRDQAINEVIRAGIRQDVRVAVIDPYPNHMIPIESGNVGYIEEGFGAEAVEASFRLICD